MSVSIHDRRMVCPYYKWDERKKVHRKGGSVVVRNMVHCEGGTRAVFQAEAAYNDYIDRYCTSIDGWEKCPFARDLTEFYEKEDGK